MTKPENPGSGNGNGDEGEGNDEAYSVVVVTEDDEHHFPGTAHIAVSADGSLLVGKGPVAAFSSAAWLRAYVEPSPLLEPLDP